MVLTILGEINHVNQVCSKPDSVWCGGLVAPVFPFLVAVSLCNFALQILPSEGGDCFLAPWIWAGIVTLFVQQNVISDGVSYLSLDLKRSLVLPLHPLSGEQARASLIEDEGPRGAEMNHDRPMHLPLTHYLIRCA